MKYKYLPDIAIADIAFQAYGTDVNEVFANAALAVCESMVELDSVEGTMTKEITLQEKQLDLLLFDFLSEIILLKDTDGLLFNRFEVAVERGDINKLRCVAHGDVIDREKHRLNRDVKAVTLHMFELVDGKDGWTAMVIIDI